MCNNCCTKLNSSRIFMNGITIIIYLPKATIRINVWIARISSTYISYFYFTTYTHVCLNGASTSNRGNYNLNVRVGYGSTYMEHAWRALALSTHKYGHMMRLKCRRPTCASTNIIRFSCYLYRGEFGRYFIFMLIFNSLSVCVAFALYWRLNGWFFFLKILNCDLCNV